MHDPIPGSCLCGASRFQLIPPTEFCSHCHCRSCRKSHAAPLVTWTSVPEAQLQVLGADLTTYKSSQNVTWLFCRLCGSHLFYRCTDAPGRVYVSVASLDGPLDRQPDSHVSYEEKVPWLHLQDGLPCFVGKTDELCQPEGRGR